MTAPATNVVRFPTTPADVQALARLHTEEAINMIVFVMKSPGAAHAVRLQAAASILDRGWGKPTQAIAGEDGGALVVKIGRFSDEATAP